jgi:predicted adenylyl cyclase CyaB
MQAARNLELKARLADPDAVVAKVRALPPRHCEVQHQVDTYFAARRGRLKLREIDGERAELIAYERPDRTDVRASSYRVVPAADPGALAAALAAALGVRGRVVKRREIYLWENVRIHIDSVDGLGTFLEFEAVIGENAGDEISRQRLETLSERLGIRSEDTIAGSYSDLLGL